MCSPSHEVDAFDCCHGISIPKFKGLSAAARAAKRQLALTSNLAKKVVQLDEACAWLRHASESKADSFVRELIACLDADPTEPKADSCDFGSSGTAELALDSLQTWFADSGPKYSDVQTAECECQTDASFAPSCTVYFGYWAVPSETGAVGHAAIDTQGLSG